MMDRFVFPKSFYDSIKTFKPVQRDMLYTAIFAYVFEDKSTQFANNDLARVWILIQPVLTKSKKISETKSEQCRDNVATMSGHSKDNVETTLNTRLKEKEKEKDKGDTPKSPKGNVSPDFEKFWNAYPKSRRVKKQAAIKAFDKARPVWKNDGKSIDDIVSALEKQKKSEAWTKDNGAYIPHPTSWLNQGRWDDIVEQTSEPEQDEYVPITPLDKCKVCGSKNVVTKGMHAICLNGDCGVSYVWHNKWVEEC